MISHTQSQCSTDSIALQIWVGVHVEVGAMVCSKGFKGHSHTIYCHFGQHWTLNHPVVTLCSARPIHSYKYYVSLDDPTPPNNTQSNDNFLLSPEFKESRWRNAMNISGVTISVWFIIVLGFTFTSKNLHYILLSWKVLFVGCFMSSQHYFSYIVSVIWWMRWGGESPGPHFYQCKGSVTSHPILAWYERNWHLMML